MPLRPRHGRALNAAGFSVIIWLFVQVGSSCLIGCLVTVLYAPAVGVAMAAMAAFCGYVAFTAAAALLREVRSPYL
jgi:hypothetical protein